MQVQSQTFYIDSNSVAGAATVFLTGIDLYFQSVPGNVNTSGNPSPTVTVSISDTDISGAPSYSNGYVHSITSLPLSYINSSTDASKVTTFNFVQPVPVNTGQMYSVNIQLSDSAFTLWTAKSGDALVGTNVAFPGFSGGHQGAFYDYGNDGNLTPIQGTQLKYSVKIAQFTANSATFQLVNDPYEFMTVTNQSAAFAPSEGVFPILANVSAQTVSFSTTSANVTGTGTKFTSQFIAGSYLIAYANTSQFMIAQVNNITSDKLLTLTSNATFTNTTGANFFNAPIGNVYFSDQSSNTLILNSSTANTALYFQAYPNLTGTVTSACNVINNISTTAGLIVGQPVFSNVSGITTGTTIASIVNSTAITMSSAYTATTASNTPIFFPCPIVGARTGTIAYLLGLMPYPVNAFLPDLGVGVPQGGNTSFSYMFAQSNGSATIANNSSFYPFINNTKTVLNQNSGLVLSRSLEVRTPTTLASNSKSAVFKLQISQNANTTTGIFSSPYIYSEALNVFSTYNEINNTVANENTNNGLTKAKHITTKIAFDPTYAAQDLLVQASAFLPTGTAVIAYAKLYNSTDPDSFNSKQWTRLVPLSQGVSSNVSTISSNNYISLSYGLPNMPLSLYTANGTVTIGTAYNTSTANNTIVGAGTHFGTEILVNDIVRIWNPNAPTVYQVATVTAITNTTSLTINKTVANSSILGQPGWYIDKISNPYTAYTDPQNYNVATYYNSSLTAFATYDTVQVKMDLLSTNTSVVPRLAALTAVGISA